MAERMIILIKHGNYANFMAASILAGGAAASDMELTVFVMEDAVYYLKNDMYMAPPKFESKFPEFVEKMEAAANSPMVTPWYDLIRELKEFSEIKFIVCSMISDALGLTKADFPDFVDEIAGVASFAAVAAGAEIILTL